MPIVQRLVVLGSTGSIGTQTLNIVDAYPDRLSIKGLAAGNNISLFLSQIQKYRPSIVSIQSDRHLDAIRALLKKENIPCEVTWGRDGLVQCAQFDEYDTLVLAVPGIETLLPAEQAIKQNKKVCLASKEVLVAAGSQIMALAQEKQVSILPLDSEHAAVKQCLEAVQGNTSLVNKVTLTASGGPFWQRDPSQFHSISKQQALKHPNWKMGQKITIDSATLMNKGFEIIEAHHLFGLSFDQLEVIIHPQSFIHALVEFKDGNVLGHLGVADMRFAIQFALTYPEKLCNNWPKANFVELGRIDFFAPDYEKFPLLKLAYAAGRSGGSAPVVLNAANEAAVKLFLEEKISFIEIVRIIEESLSKNKEKGTLSIADTLALDQTVKSIIFEQYDNSILSVT